MDDETWFRRNPRRALRLRRALPGEPAGHVIVSEQGGKWYVPTADLKGADNDSAIRALRARMFGPRMVFAE
jgi:hypothetical protein